MYETYPKNDLEEYLRKKVVERRAQRPATGLTVERFRRRMRSLVAEARALHT